MSSRHRNQLGGAEVGGRDELDDHLRGTGRTLTAVTAFHLRLVA